MEDLLRRGELCDVYRVLRGTQDLDDKDRLRRKRLNFLAAF